MDNGSGSPYFCSSCGASLRESDTFCSMCGANIGSDGIAVSRSSYTYARPKSNRLLIIGILSLAWAIFALMGGVSVITGAEAAVDNVFSTTDPHLLDAAGLSYDALVSFLVVTGAMIILSGVFALITALTSFFKRFYVVALATCIISSILAIMTIFGIIVGLIVAYFISRSKEEFKDAASMK